MQVDDLLFSLTVLLGRTQIPLTTYLELQVGDILVLDQKLENGLAVRVGSKTLFYGSAGLIGTHKAISIDERISK
jgi:flagellar motor switch protein FliM